MIDVDAYRDAPLFITDLQRMIAALPPPDRQRVTLISMVDGRGRFRRLDFELPRGEALNAQGALLERYVLAMVNNMVVSFAGASLAIYADTSDGALRRILQRAIAAFDVDAPRNDRTGYGVYVNYIGRMNRFLGLDRFQMRLYDARAFVPPDPALTFYLYEPGDAEAERALLRRSATELHGKRFCSLDVGGNSIKGAVVSDGRVLVVKEYKWYPTGMKLASEMNGAQLLMLRFLALMTRLIEDGGGEDEFADALGPAAPFDAVEAACRALEQRGYRAWGTFDAIVIGFPDIVVQGKIAGGESFKHQGMKNNPDVDYEAEFMKTSSLDDLARPYAREGGEVVVLNDGNAASYITSVEQAFERDSIIGEYGLFANTIGTEMGTGFISRGGTIQHIPLEGFQHVIDLGNARAAALPAADVRSTASMNTGVPGTVQKYISQLGLFRLCVSGFLERDPAMVDRLIADGLLVRDGEELRVAVEPIDRRGQLTRLLVDRLDEGDPVVRRAFLEMGKAMGVLIDLDLQIFPEIAPTRLLSGGIVASNAAFSLIAEGLKRHNPGYRLLRLDEETMASPLLKSIGREERNFSVAIGSAYIGNRFLIEPERSGE